MENVELVIKIPYEDYVKISNSNPSYADDFSIYYAIKNGKRLPKGHGRLKDVDHYCKMQWEHPDYSLMDDEATVIEADTENGDIN